MSESQTLTTGAEANMLKFKELTILLSEEGSKRWEEIKHTFQRNLVLGVLAKIELGKSWDR